MGLLIDFLSADAYEKNDKLRLTGAGAMALAAIGMAGLWAQGPGGGERRKLCLPRWTRMVTAR